jgi:Mg/Co/Ni transporter MgtE
MTDSELKNILIGRAINNIPFHQTVELIRNFSETVVTAELEKLTEDQKEELKVNLTPEEAPQEAPEEGSE